MRRAAAAAVAAMALLAGVLVARTLALRPPADAGIGSTASTPLATGTVPVDADGAAARLAGAIRFPTVSTAAEDPPPALEALHAYLAESFRHLHQVLEREIVGDHSLLYTWRGARPELAPILLAAHLDVVPAGNRASWTHPPFAGAVADGYVWGRGALDDKLGVLGQLEAVEILVRGGFVPRRTVYLAFGHDEEIGGERGARAIAGRLAERGVRLDLVLDEGLAIVDGVIDGVAPPVAAIGVAEKGYLSLELLARAPGGHASMAPRDTAIGRLARALTRLESRPMTARLDGPSALMLTHLAPTFPFRVRLLLANRWLFDPLLLRALAAEPGPAAALRTTLVPTVVAGGVKDNVLPTEARAVINARIHPRDSLAGVERHVRAAVADPAIAIRRLGTFASEPSAVSPADGPAFDLLSATVRQLFPDALVTPALVLGGTDARHYAGLSDRIYRFVPVPLTAGDLARVHGADERVAVADYARAVAFYAQLIRNAAGR